MEFHGIGNGTRHSLFAVDFGQGDDLPYVVAAVEMAFIQLPVVILRAVGQRQETLEEVLISCLLSLDDELLGVIRVLEVAVAFVGAAVPSDQLFFVIEARSG